MKIRNEIKILKHKSIIKFEGKDFLGEVGVDGRIFKALTYARISVGVISQQAVENGISVLVNEKDAEKAVNCLIEEFEKERKSGKVSQIFSINNVSVISIVANDFTKIMTDLARNNVFPIILNQVAAQFRANIVVTASQDEKAKNIIEAEIFAKPKTLHLAIIGHGRVGDALIRQIFDKADYIRNRKKIDLKIVAIANSRKIAFNKEGFNAKWNDEILNAENSTGVEALLKFAHQNNLENFTVVDNTASRDFVKNYQLLAENGFDLVSSNKIFNTLSISEYRDFRHILRKKNKKYLYETNVGAGLPLIDTIKLLHLSGENITRINGIFSGALSYIFNNFSAREEKFSIIMKEALAGDLSGNDLLDDLTGRDFALKLLILARELDLSNEITDVKINSLLPASLAKMGKDDILEKVHLLDNHFEDLKSKLQKDHVLRYVGELTGNLQLEKGILEVKLISVPLNSALGQVKGSDSVFEIFTENYGENPLVIKGAGGGADVTARGVFGDILRLSEIK